ncbi:flagellar hook protein FlgE [soil metagenome]
MSFQQGLSGLSAASKNLEVIGHNVANANTYGEKASRAEFADMYANALTGSSGGAVGIGVNVAAVTQQFTQGSITSTGGASDLAINGNGFFQVSNGSTTSFTRNGQFQVSKDGSIVTNTGLKLMGYPASASGVIQPGAASPLSLPTAGINPSPTTEMTLEMNLNSAAATTLPASTPTINFGDAATYNNATSVTAFDAKGQPVAVTYYFQKTATDNWNIYATANGTSVNVDGSGNPLPVTAVTFAADGSAPTSPAGAVTLDIPASTNSVGAATLPITGIQIALGSSTQYGSPFAVTNLKQDGFAAGQLTGLVIEDDGVVMANYSNGQSKAAGQVELATFRNAQGLRPQGGNLWAASQDSGTPIVGTPGSGNLGVLQSGALEESNVDMTSELVNMMTAQRYYQANAQTIKTQDQVLQTLVNLR